MMTNVNFTVPEKFIPRERFTAKMDKEGKGWPKGTVKVYDNGVEIYSYHRNYSLLRTFEPFRQCREGHWTNYALISTKYVRFEVLNLDTREIVAVEPYPVITQEWQDRILKFYTAEEKKKAKLEEYLVGKEMPGAGFCPMEFYVPDWWEGEEDDSTAKLFGTEEWTKYKHIGVDYEALSGEFGLYTGCVWGDDSSSKLRYIDLSRISEGIVTSDDRFGYFEFWGSLREQLKDSMSYFSEGSSIRIPMEVSVNLKSGKVYYMEDVNWRKDE